MVISSSPFMASVFSILVTEKKMYLAHSLSLLKLNNKMIFRESLLLYSKTSARTSEFHVDILKMPNVNKGGTRFSDCLIIWFFFNLLLFFWLRCVFTAARRLSLVAASGGYSSLRCAGFSVRWLLLLRSMGSRHTGFSSCSTREIAFDCPQNVWRQFSMGLSCFFMSCEQRHQQAFVLHYFFKDSVAWEDGDRVSLQSRKFVCYTV